MDTARTPITDPAELTGLDDAETVEGYMDGHNGEPEPGDNRSKSYWHGWRNGSIDGGHREKDAAAAELARRVIAEGYLKRRH